MIVVALLPTAAIGGAEAQTANAAPSDLIRALPDPERSGVELSDVALPVAPLADAPGSCHLRGVIRTQSGESANGSHIRLTSSDGKTILEGVTREGGAYGWDGLAVGEYTLSITTEGYLPAVYRIRLPEPGGTAVVDVRLKLPSSTDSVTVTASEGDIAKAELQVEEEQRLAGIFPNFFVSYQWQAASLTARQKFALAFKNASDPGNLLLVGTTAGVQQAIDAFPGYGQGAAGYGRRFGADLGNLVVGTFVGGAVLPSIFHQDPRYFYRGTGSVPSRLWYAATRAVVTRGDNGQSQPNWSGVLGDLSAGAISNLYYAPQDRMGARLTFVNGLLGIGGDAMNGVFQEFFLRRLTSHTQGRNGKATSTSMGPVEDPGLSVADDPSQAANAGTNDQDANASSEFW